MEKKFEPSETDAISLHRSSENHSLEEFSKLSKTGKWSGDVAYLEELSNMSSESTARGGKSDSVMWWNPQEVHIDNSEIDPVSDFSTLFTILRADVLADALEAEVGQPLREIVHTHEDPDVEDITLPVKRECESSFTEEVHIDNSEGDAISAFTTLFSILGADVLADALEAEVGQPLRELVHTHDDWDVEDITLPVRRKCESSITEDCTLPEVLVSAATSQEVAADNGPLTSFISFSDFICTEGTSNNELVISQPAHIGNAESCATNDHESDPFDDFTSLLSEGLDALDRGCLAMVDALETGVGEPLKHLVGAQDAAPNEVDGDSMLSQLAPTMPEPMAERKHIVIGDAPLLVTESKDPLSTPLAVLEKGCNATLFEVTPETDGEVRARISFPQLNGATHGWISTKFNGLILVAEAFGSDVTARTMDIAALQSELTTHDHGVPFTCGSRFFDPVIMMSTMLLIIAAQIFMWGPMLTSRTEH